MGRVGDIPVRAFGIPEDRTGHVGPLTVTTGWRELCQDVDTQPVGVSALFTQPVVGVNSADVPNRRTVRELRPVVVLDAAHHNG